MTSRVMSVHVSTLITDGAEGRREEPREHNTTQHNTMALLPLYTCMTDWRPLLFSVNGYKIFSLKKIIIRW